MVTGVQLNLLLLAFNLMPIPPLDGSHVMKYFLAAVRGPCAISGSGFYGIGILVLILYLAPRAARPTGCTRRMSSARTLLDAVEALRASFRLHDGCSDRDASSHRSPMARTRSPSSCRSSPGRSICCSRSFARSRSTSTTFRSRASAQQFVERIRTLAAQRRRRVSRDGRATPAHQSADAAARAARKSSGRIRARSSFVGCSSTNRCARSSTCSSVAARSAAISSRARICPAQPAPPQAPLALSLAELLAAVDRVLRAASRPDMHDVIPRALDIPGAIDDHSLGARAAGAHPAGRDIIASGAEPWQVLSTLLGLLELAKLGELRVAAAPTLRQRGNLSP